MDITEKYRGHPPEELRDAAADLEVQAREIAYDQRGELRVLKSADNARVENLLAERSYVLRLLEKDQRARDQFRRGVGIETPYQGLGGDRLQLESGEVSRLRGDEARSAALRVLDGQSKKLEPDQADRVAKLIEDAQQENRDDSYLARRLLLTETPAYRSAYQRLMSQPHPVLSAEEAEAVRAFENFERYENRAMGEITPSAGGFGVPVFIDPSIIMTAQGSGNDFFSIASVAEVTTNLWKGVTSAGVTWSFDTEGSAVSDDSPTLAQPSILVHMARGFLPFSIEVGMDYPDFAKEMATILAEGYDELLVDKFSRGSGSGEPQGVITALDADTNVEVLLTTAGAYGEVDVYNLWKALPQRFRRKASWMMSVGVNNATRRFGTSLSHAYTTNLVGETLDSLFNRKVYESPYFSDTVNTTGHFNQAVVGDFRNYKIARRLGMSTELVPTLFDITNNRPTGQRGWFAYARIGGGVVNNQGFRVLNQT